MADGERRVAVVGVSTASVCGVRDHAAVLAQALREDRLLCSLHWLTRRERSLRDGRREIAAWRRELAAALERERPDVILLHYSVFAYSHRGLPVFVRPVLATLRAAGAPIVAILHELVYPWRLGGWRGHLWAAAQRALLVDVVRASHAVVVTADFRAGWLHSRRWLPRRPVSVAPVFSNLPPPSPRARPLGQEPTIGVFGYAYEGAGLSLVLDAVARLDRRGVRPRLALLGAPGRDSPSGQSWLAAAHARGVAQALRFSGPLPAQALSDELAGCDVLLFCDASGPSSRKGTLAAALASGAPVVAVDGRRSWRELSRSGAARVVEPNARTLADALAGLLTDRSEGEALGTRGRRFAQERMSVRRSADLVRELLVSAAVPPR